MSYTLNNKLKNLVPYSPIEGQYEIRLDANESFITPSDELISKIKEAIGKVEFNRYPDPYAKKVCRLFSEFYGLDANFVTAGNGSDELISIIITSFLTSEDKLLVLEPDFSMYKFYAQLCSVCVVDIIKDDNFLISADDIIKTIVREKPRCIIFSNPCNPASTGITAKDVKRIIASTDSLVIVDEAYMDFWDESVLGEINNFDNLIVLKTCSKALGFASIRLGFAVAQSKITKAIRAAKSPYNVNSLTQTVGEVVFSEPSKLSDNIEKIIDSRDYLYKNFLSLSSKYSELEQVIKPNTNFIFVKCKNPLVIFEALKEKGIIIRCMPPYLRITAGSDFENNELIKEISKILENKIE